MVKRQEGRSSQNYRRKGGVSSCRAGWRAHRATMRTQHNFVYEKERGSLIRKIRTQSRRLLGYEGDSPGRASVRAGRSPRKGRVDVRVVEKWKGKRTQSAEKILRQRVPDCS